MSGEKERLGNILYASNMKILVFTEGIVIMYSSARGSTREKRMEYHLFLSLQVSTSVHEDIFQFNKLWYNHAYGSTSCTHNSCSSKGRENT